MDDINVHLPFPHPKQDEILSHPARFKVMVAGRRFGKTIVSLEKCVLEASNPKSTIWYIAPTYRQSKLIAWKILSEWLHDPIFKRNETELSVQLPNGSTIALKGAMYQIVL